MALAKSLRDLRELSELQLAASEDDTLAPDLDADEIEDLALDSDTEAEAPARDFGTSRRRSAQDLSVIVQSRPLAAAGLAVGVGFVLGLLTIRRR